MKKLFKGSILAAVIAGLVYWGKHSQTDVVDLAMAHPTPFSLIALVLGLYLLARGFFSKDEITGGLGAFISIMSLMFWFFARVSLF